jgi:multiple sugar transport system permease protein
MGKKVQLEKRYSKWGYIFVIPFVIVFLAFHFWPLASTIYYAFCYLKHAGNTNPQFLPSIGKPLFKNFQ